jgi:hypothetical protein
MNASELIGVLPERRTDLKRIDIESVVKWSEAVFGETIDGNGFFFLTGDCYLRKICLYFGVVNDIRNLLILLQNLMRRWRKWPYH